MRRLVQSARYGVLLGSTLCVAMTLCVTMPLLAQRPGFPAFDAIPNAEKGPLPFWTPPNESARKDLGAVTRSLSQAVMIVGHSKGGHGTGWVLSAKHRLIATNAHVADLKGAAATMLAVVNGTAQDYKVEKVWYHPGVRRMLPGGEISIHSECPADGDVYPSSPDVAVLQLAGDGPELTAEFPMATFAELQGLFAGDIGMLGFPSHDTLAFPGREEKAQGTYHVGVVSRLTDFRMSVKAPPEELQFVQHTIQSFGGFSGSPIFLPNGHVVAIHNCSVGRENSGKRVDITRGIRVDCLWELLVHHGLDSKVPVPVDKSKLRIERWLQLDEDEKKFRKAQNLVAEAANLIDFEQEFQAGIYKCTEAIEIAPQYADAYRVRCAGLNNYYSFMQPPKNKAAETLKLALKDADKYSKLMRDSDPRVIILRVNTEINVAALRQDKELLRPSLASLNERLEIANLHKEFQAELYSLRGMCQFNLGDKKPAKNDFDQSIRLDPQNDLLFENRARFWDAIGSFGLAKQDRDSAETIRKQRLSQGRPSQSNDAP